MAPDEPIREDELEIVPLLQLGLTTGVLDQPWMTRLGRGYAEGTRLIANVEKDVWQARFIAPVLASGADQQTPRELASQLSGDLNFASLVDRALMAAYRRQQELAWIEQLVEDIEAALEEAGVLGRTVNLAARIAAYASGGRVLVSEPVVQRPPPQGVTFVELGPVQLEGIAHPVRLLEARRA
jgi:hypothetical protein